ncbi:hypothetical protein D3C74_323740 [compost metagenome]
MLAKNGTDFSTDHHAREIVTDFVFFQTLGQNQGSRGEGREHQIRSALARLRYLHTSLKGRPIRRWCWLDELGEDGLGAEQCKRLTSHGSAEFGNRASGDLDPFGVRPREQEQLLFGVICVHGGKINGTEDLSFFTAHDVWKFFEVQDAGDDLHRSARSDLH